MKIKIKYFVLGFAVAVLISAFSMAVGAAMQQKTIDISYGEIKICVDGTEIVPKDANGNPVEPFISDGTTYLPVRAVANAFGKAVEWDGETKTVYLGAQPSKSGYSRTNPAPVGVTQKVVMEDYYPDSWTEKYKYNASVTVKNVWRGEEAWEILKKANMFNSKADEGYEYILAYISVNITELSEEFAAKISSYDFDFYSTDYTKYTNSSYCVMPEQKNLNGTVYNGGMLEGYICQQVKIGDSTPTLVFNQDYNDVGGIWFSLTK